ncbi:transcriptional initiation protein Tat [Lujinxingia litoralis]|uniref:Transcriptional initiation protein Tat n=1 Tax=Lujinxingia litoralis TaxID=2211119 RepID=A0A328C5S8_9DELT|nr:DUF1501 domain-containing protein [Lujinxingia litoralis]RAL22849.1 transcriptional initiation protein Tat [Lujinxingia litoralis]
MSDNADSSGIKFGRRSFLKGLGVAAASIAMPHIWIPNSAIAQTEARGAAKHLIYIRLSGGFRFTAAFNSDAAAEFNPFGKAENVASGAEWGVGKLFELAGWLNGDQGAQRAALGMRPLTEMADQIAVLPCIDHEPLSARADGNHNTGLQRFNTGYVGGGTSFLTMINYGLRERFEAARQRGEVALPAFSLGDSGMALGSGIYAAHRPPVMQGDGFESFGFSAANTLPEWAQMMSASVDQRYRDVHHPQNRAPVDAYMQTRAATELYAEIFNDDVLKIRNGSDEPIDGLSNQDLATIFGNSRAARNVRLALRLFHFGCPAVYFNQGSYDMHSGEENGLPRHIEELGHLLSGLEVALKAMSHPEGGTYWDHTLVVCGSEFGRTARGSRFNSARGSDHAGDYATRWMSMPVMGGLITAAGKGGRSLGMTRPSDLAPEGQVYSYRSLLKTLMDALGCDHREFFPADRPFDDLFA